MKKTIKAKLGKAEAAFKEPKTKSEVIREAAESWLGHPGQGKTAEVKPRNWNEVTDTEAKIAQMGKDFAVITRHLENLLSANAVMSTAALRKYNDVQESILKEMASLRRDIVDLKAGKATAYTPNKPEDSAGAKALPESMVTRTHVLNFLLDELINEKIKKHGL